MLSRLRSLVLWRRLDNAYRRHFAHYLALHDAIPHSTDLYERLNPRRFVYLAEACRRLSVRHRRRALGRKWSDSLEEPTRTVNRFAIADSQLD